MGFNKRYSCNYDDNIYLIDMVLSDMYYLKYKPHSKIYIKKKYRASDPEDITKYLKYHWSLIGSLND